MHLAETAYEMPTGMLLHEAGRQFAMAEIVRDGGQQTLYERGGWFLLLVWAERTCGVTPTAPALPTVPEGYVLVPIKPTPAMVDVMLDWGTKRSEWEMILRAAQPAAGVDLPDGGKSNG